MKQGLYTCDKCGTKTHSNCEIDMKSGKLVIPLPEGWLDVAPLEITFFKSAGYRVQIIHICGTCRDHLIEFFKRPGV